MNAEGAGESLGFLEENQGTETTAHVPKMELSISELYLAVQSGSGWVVHSDIRGMHPSHPHHQIFGCDDVQSSISWVGFKFLQDEVRFIGFHKFNEADLSVLHLNFVGERIFAKFTFEFRQVVSRDKSAVLFCHFALKPGHQTVDVHKFA